MNHRYLALALLAASAPSLATAGETPKLKIGDHVVGDAHIGGHPIAGKITTARDVALWPMLGRPDSAREYTVHGKDGKDYEYLGEADLTKRKSPLQKILGAVAHIKL